MSVLAKEHEAVLVDAKDVLDYVDDVDEEDDAYWVANCCWPYSGKQR